MSEFKAAIAGPPRAIAEARADQNTSLIPAALKVASNQNLRIAKGKAEGQQSAPISVIRMGPISPRKLPYVGIDRMASLRPNSGHCGLVSPAPEADVAPSIISQVRCCNFSGFRTS